MRKNAKVTEGRFKAIKILLNSGATQKECAESMGMSVCTIGTINRSETYEEYRNSAYLRGHYVRKQMDKESESVKEDPPVDVSTLVEEESQAETRTQIVEHRQTVMVQANQYLMEEMRKTNELLTLISNKLAFIVDELTK